jgi:ribosomal protein S18 acetylase RimI-like enzyme
MAGHELNIKYEDVESLRLTIEPLEWDSLIIGKSVARLVNPAISLSLGERDAAAAAARLKVFAEVTQTLRQLKFQYVTVRRPQQNWWELQAWESAGFQGVDTILESFRELEPTGAKHTPVKLPSGYSFRPATAEDAEAVGALAVKTFRLSRFHNDPLLTPEIADKIHFEWAKNCCLGIAATQVWLIEASGQVAGFVSNKVKESGKTKTGVIDLIAVAGGESGRGFGKGLLRQSEGWFGAFGCTGVSVRTQANNYAALGLYTSAGYQIREAQNTLRWSSP